MHSHSSHTEVKSQLIEKEPFQEVAPLPLWLSEKIADLLHAPHWMGLALHLPLRFEDRSTLTSIDHLQLGEKVNLIATVVGHEIIHRPRKQLKIWVQDKDHDLLLRWLHFYPGQIDKMPAGARLKITGQVRAGYRGTLEMIHPQVTRILASQTEPPTPSAQTDTATENSQNAKLEPVYPSRLNIKQRDWQNWTKQLPQACFEDTLSPPICDQYQLLSWPKTLQTLHGQATPTSLKALNDRSHPAWQRVKFDELLAQQLLLKKFRQEKQKQKAMALQNNQQDLVERFIQQLAFALTQAQQRAFKEIRNDMGKTVPMQRLLQGDVGSGKTVVAALACLHAVQSYAQAAIAAPTEVLAQQHFNKLQPLFSAIGLNTVLLHGRLKTKQKKAIYQQIELGDVHIVIGTHALFQDTVAFHNLAFVVVDEQHRFGVAQRLNFISKASGNHLAHQLMMSATPIPRTLAQTYLADLAVSYLDEKPPGRKPIITKLLANSKREQLILAIEAEIEKGQQVYWVCPLIEESEKIDLQAAESTAQELCDLLPHRQIALLHSKLEPQAKQDIMQAFTTNKVDILVSTTVIEVGVDVPNATLMVIDQAERFGLAQMHQLRGRVGRGSLQSTCILLFGAPLSQTAKSRLKAMHESDDGFYLAEVDLEIRGPGDLLGKRQSGLPVLRYADPIEDKHLVNQARELADTLPIEALNTQRHIERWLTPISWWLS